MWQSSYMNTLNKNIMIVQVKKKKPGKKSNIKITWSSPIQLSYRKESMCLGHLLPECVASVPNRTTKLVLSTKPTRHVHKRLFCFTRLAHALGGLFSICAKVYWSQSVAFYRCTWSYDAWLVHLYCTDDRLMSVWMKIHTVINHRQRKWLQWFIRYGIMRWSHRFDCQPWPPRSACGGRQQCSCTILSVHVVHVQRPTAA